MHRDGGGMRAHLVARDSSGHGNDLPLVSPPLRHDVVITKVGRPCCLIGHLRRARLCRPCCCLCCCAVVLPACLPRCQLLGVHP